MTGDGRKPPAPPAVRRASDEPAEAPPAPPAAGAPQDQQGDRATGGLPARNWIVRLGAVDWGEDDAGH